MPQCKRCGQSTVWNKAHQKETGKWVPFDEDTGEPHACPNYNGPKGYEREYPESHTVQTAQPQQQQAPSQAATATLAASYEVASSLNAIKESIHRVEIQVQKQVEYYGELVNYLSSIVNNTHKNQAMAESEAHYDQDKEDGLV